MTIYDTLAMALLIITITVNSSLAYLQKTRHIYRRFGKKSLRLHGTIISVFWGLFIASEFLSSRSTWRFDRNYPLSGFGLMAIAVVMFGLAIKQIGFPALANGNLLSEPSNKKLKGIYRYIREPIYWSYSIWFAGIGLASSLKVFIVLSLIGVIGLVGVESWAERPPSD
ncbi:MAG: methyltransferase [Candidatus Saccharimonadales bacterium]